MSITTDCIPGPVAAKSSVSNAIDRFEEYASSENARISEPIASNECANESLYYEDEGEDFSIPLFPDELNEIQPIELIGTGTFGRVFVAKDTRLSKHVAVKMIDFASDPAFKKEDLRYLFLKEVQMLQICRLLSSDNIIQVIDSYSTQEEGYLITEVFGSNWSHCNDCPEMRIFRDSNMLSERFFFKPSFDLEGCLGSIILTDTLKANIIQQIASAIFHLHGADIIHRDLKSANILINFNFQIKIIDFGLATVQKDSELHNHQCGTVAYLAPETLLAECMYRGKPVDVWAFGCIMYNILFNGHFPFSQPEVEEGLQMEIISNFKERLDQLSNQQLPFFAKRLLFNVLEYNPMERLSIEDIVGDFYFYFDDFIKPDFDVNDKALVIHPERPPGFTDTPVLKKGPPPGFER